MVALRLEVQARHARHEVGVAVEAVHPRGQRLARTHAGLVAPGAQRGDRGDHRANAGFGLGVAQRVVGAARLLDGEQVLRAGHVRPQLLGDERDHRVGEQQRLAQDVQHRGREIVVVLAAGWVGPFHKFQIPIAELAVDELIQTERGLGEVDAHAAPGAGDEPGLLVSSHGSREAPSGTE